MFDADNPCPRAKLLVGSYQCPCHGLHPKVAKKKAPPAPKPVRVARAPKPVKPPRVVKLSDPEEQEVCRNLYVEGATIAQLAEKFGCSNTRIQSVIADLVRPPDRLTPDEKVDIARRYLDGESISSIARAYGRDRWAIYGALGKKRDKKKVSQ